MKHIRVIPRLDIKGPNLVKGIHLEGLRVLGKPERFAKLYYEQGADELIFQDTVASLYQRNSLTDIVEKTANEIFIPLTVGGGLRTLDDINEVLRAGADKVSINTAAVKKSTFISEASRAFGSSTIVIAVEAIKQPDNSFLAYTDNGREYTGLNVLEWVKEVEDLGAGEILLTSIDQEGTGRGFDLELIEQVAEQVTIPIIAHGGCGDSSDIIQAVSGLKADAVAISSMLHYNALNENDFTESDFDNEGNIEFLKKKNENSMFGDENIYNIKSKLNSENFVIRILD